MSAALFAVGVGAGILLVVLLLLFAIAARRNRRTGRTGFVQRSRLTCPKCHQVFDYTWVPGAALDAVRLGSARYMACPLCRRWSIFDIASAPVPPEPAPA